MKVGKLLKCILNQYFLAGYQSDSIDFHFFIKLYLGTKRAPDDSVYPTMLVQTQNLSEYDWAEEIGGKGQGGPGGEGGA